jgi:hypothetical protein
MKGRIHFEPLRKPGKVRELAMGYSASIDLARKFRDEYRDVYWALVTMAYLRYNPQMLLTDQRSEEQKIDDAIRPLMKARLDAFFDEIIGVWVDEGKLDFPSGGTVTGRWSGRSITPRQAQGEFVIPRPRFEDLYRKG